MKKAVQIILDDREVLELVRILIDDDATGALIFLRKHLKGKAQELLEGG